MLAPALDLDPPDAPLPGTLQHRFSQRRGSGRVRRQRTGGVAERKTDQSPRAQQGRNLRHGQESAQLASRRAPSNNRAGSR